MKRTFLSLFLLTAFVSQSLAQAAIVKITPAERKMAESITADQLSNYLYFVASDAMGGRDTPSHGLDVTAEFLKMNLQRWGFKPAGDDGTFFQKIAIRNEVAADTNNTLSIGGQNFKIGEDYFRFAGNSALNAPLVFVRDGWMVKAKNIDAFSGVDVKGKIVVVYGQGFARASNLTRRPAGVTDADVKGTKGTDWADALTYARNSGAAGLILLASTETQAAWPGLKGFLGRGTSVPDKLRDPDPNQFPVILASSKVGDAIFAGEAGNKDSATAFAINKSAAMSTAGRVETKWTQNVVAMWEGSDTVLKSEMVAIGAHYDHIGTSQTNCRAVKGDNICNGADDDGSGTVAILSIAEAFAKSKMRPKRSVLFVWHTGEEKGLWGAEYFKKFPTIDIKKVTAQLNIDMIGRSKKPDDTNLKNKDLTGENAIYVIGKDMMSSTLGSIVDNVNKSYLGIGYDTKYDDPKDTNKFFFRSDHFHYALNGIPITFWFDGVHEDYHGPGDEAHKIDYAKMEKITRTIMLTLLELTDLKERPKIDKELPPELTQR